MGKAAYVWDRAGGDGWVTPDSYGTFEADGFSGAATDGTVDRERLKADLASYRPEFGDLAFDLVRQHHSAAKHAEALLALLAAGQPSRAPGALETIDLLVRAEQRAVARAEAAEFASGQVWEGREWMAGQSERAEAAAAEAERRASAEEARRIAAEERLGAVLGSRSWRLTGLLRRGGGRRRGR